MKQKVSTFISAFFIYGLIFGIGIYFFEKATLKVAFMQAVFFGFFMGFFEVFINPKIKAYFSKKNKKT